MDMKEFRIGCNTTEHYTSLEEMGKAWNCRPVSKKTKDEKKLADQQQKFVNRHLCKGCKNPMQWVENTSTMVCKNPSCKGIKHTRLDLDGNEIVTYLPSYDLLDEVGTNIANILFS
jgi:hypothetical protein